MKFFTKVEDELDCGCAGKVAPWATCAGRGVEAAAVVVAVAVGADELRKDGAPVTRAAEGWVGSSTVDIASDRWCAITGTTVSPSAARAILGLPALQQPVGSRISRRVCARGGMAHR